MMIAPIYLRSAQTACYSCRELITVHCLVAKAVVDEDVVDGEIQRETIDSDDHLIRVSDIESLDARVEASLVALAPNFRKTFSRTQGATVFMNHCPHCAARQGDFFLHSDPDGPFFGGETGDGVSDRLLFDRGEFGYEGSFNY